MPAPNPDRSPLRAPLLAGLAAACVFIAGAVALSVFTGGEPGPVSAEADIARPPEPVILAEAEPVPAAPDPVPFEFAVDEEVSLPGVSDTEAALNAPPAPATPTAPAAPLPGLWEDGPGGPLPMISADGRRPDEAYARAHAPRTGPVVALIVGGLGMSERLTLEAIETLPPEVTLSFAPYANDLQGWIDRARAAGHEVLIELPMEPFDYPNNDPGPPHPAGGRVRGRERAPPRLAPVALGGLCRSDQLSGRAPGRRARAPVTDFRPAGGARPDHVP